MMPTRLFLFLPEHTCECGRNLGGSYVELFEPEPNAARRKMESLRGRAWSHEVNGFIPALLGVEENPALIRATHQRLPANAQGESSCFCGELGQPVVYAQERERAYLRGEVPSRDDGDRPDH